MKVVEKIFEDIIQQQIKIGFMKGKGTTGAIFII